MSIPLGGKTAGGNQHCAASVRDLGEVMSHILDQLYEVVTIVHISQILKLSPKESGLQNQADPAPPATRCDFWQVSYLTLSVSGSSSVNGGIMKSPSLGN